MTEREWLTPEQLAELCRIFSPGSRHNRSCPAGWRGSKRNAWKGGKRHSAVPMNETRPVEMYVGYSSGTWNTLVVNIPYDTSECEIEQKAISEAKRLLADAQDVAFVGVYNIPSLEE